jgi:hypothetical protein
LKKTIFSKPQTPQKTDEGYKNLDKELMDLKIILDMYFHESENLYEARLDKFIENLSKG